jgi:hypothetical protein
LRPRIGFYSALFWTGGAGGAPWTMAAHDGQKIECTPSFGVPQRAQGVIDIQ